jgi:threonine/homoserine/homoserine lactone efflux protein
MSPESTNLLSFMAVSAVVIVSPDPDLALVRRNALLGRRRIALSTSGGVAIGLGLRLATSERRPG